MSDCPTYRNITRLGVRALAWVDSHNQREGAMKVFIGGSFASRARLRSARTRLETLGYTVLAEWLDQPKEVWPDLILASNQARRDTQQIQEANFFIFDTLDPSTFGNNFVEFGIAMTRFGPRYIVGPLRNHYHVFGHTKRFDNWETCLEFIRPPIWNGGYARH